MERLVIHFGLHKTGTTAVQQYLEANCDELLRRGATLIPLERMREDVTDLFANASKREKFEGLVRGVPTPTLVLSDENISGGVDDIAKGKFYPWARDKMLGAIGTLTDLDIQLILTLRNPVELVPSLYSEYLRLHDYVSFDQYSGKVDLSSLSVWESFGWVRSMPTNVTVHVIPFETEFGGGVPVVGATILRAACGTSVGFDLRRLLEHRPRPSFTAEEVDVAGYISARAGGATARAFLRMIVDEDTRFGERRYRPIDGALAAALTARYERDLVRFGIDAPAPA